MPSDSPSSQLAWLGRRQLANRIRRFLSKPRNWGIVIGFALYIVFIVLTFGLLLRPGPGVTLLRPSQVDEPTAAVLLALVLGYAAFVGAALGRLQLSDAESFVLGVFASPVEALSITRFRVRRMVLLVGVAASLVAVAIGTFLSTTVQLQIGPTILRIWAVVVPTTLTWVMLGLLVAASARRWGDRGGEWAIGGIAVGLLALGAWLLVQGASAVSRVLALSVALVGPYVRWILALPMSQWGAVALVLPWVAAASLGLVAYQVGYPAPGSFNSVERQRGYALGPELAPRDDLMTRIRQLLRFRYRDFGPGPRAFQGEVVTLSLRSVDLPLVGFLLFFVAYLMGSSFWLGFLSGSAPGLFVYTAFVLGLGIWSAAFLLMMMGQAFRQLLAEQVRQLPISGREALDAMLAPKRWVIALLAVLIGGGMGLAYRDPLLAVLSGMLAASALYLAALLSLWGAPYVRPPNAPAGEVNILPQLLGGLGAVAMLGGESALGLFLPSPTQWNPLWLPLAISSIANLVAIGRLRPMLDRRLVEPTREE